MPGIEYKVSVSGINMLGVQGETKHFAFQVMPKTVRSGSEDQVSSSQLVLKGPATTVSNAALYIEATFVSCDPQIMIPTLNVSIQYVNVMCKCLSVEMVAYHRSRFVFWCVMTCRLVNTIIVKHGSASMFSIGQLDTEDGGAVIFEKSCTIFQ